MLCMCCKQLFQQLYYVSEDDAKGTKIEGPLVCRACFALNFPMRPLPIPAFLDQGEYSSPVKLGTPSLASSSSALGMAYATPVVHAVEPLTLEAALQEIADANPTSCSIFTWGPLKYNLLWAKSIVDGDVIAYSLSSGKETCAQGLGVYMAQTIYASASYANTDDTSVLMLTCNNTPCIDYSSRKLREALAVLIRQMTGITMTENELFEYFNSTTCRTRAIKKYGNYWAVTTHVNVTPIFDYRQIFAVVGQAGIDRLKRDSKQGGAYLDKIKK